MHIRALARGVLLAALLPLAGGASAEALVIGALTDNAKKELSRTEPLAAYLATELADAGVTAVEVEVIPSVAGMVEALADGSVDLVFDSPLLIAQIARASGGVPFLRRWKDQTATYHSVVVVPAQSDVESVEDLAGRRIGFQAPDSTSGFMLPAGLIRRAGLPLRELGSTEEQPAPDEVGYVFTDDDKNTVLWLMSGWIDAAATDPRRLAELDAAQPGAYRVVARSIEVPRHVGLHRAGLDPALAARLAEVLVAMHETGRGRETLDVFSETTRFDGFPGGVEATFAPIHEMLDELVALGVL